MSSEPTTFGLLTSDHKVLSAQDCSDFRTPALAWVHADEDVFEDVGLSCVVSEFWVGPMEDAKAMAQGAAQEYAEWVKTIEDPDANDEDSTDEITVAYWENAALNMGMVAVIPYTDLYSLFTEDERSKHVPSLDAFPNMRMLGFDGNDNSPFELANTTSDLLELKKINQDEAEQICQFLMSITTENYQDDLADQMDDDIPGWRKATRSPAPTL